MRLFLADLAGLAEHHGTVRGYASGVPGVGGDLVAALRGRLLNPAAVPPLSFRRAAAPALTELVRLRDDAARWQIARGIDQWAPGELGEDHFPSA
ncbi:hypothetical protein [Streptomyces sp. NPDC006368]|uniref:hypothetical protein n=1 Tax=Streptomyces sp. NPDC006368 TaxID=3156760 RepID=UPI0033BE190C